MNMVKEIEAVILNAVKENKVTVSILFLDDSDLSMIVEYLLNRGFTIKHFLDESGKHCLKLSW